MKALGYSIWLQFRLDIRNKNIFSAYYFLPIAFYLVIGAILMEMSPVAEDTLIQSMSILSISLAGFLGTPAPLVDFFNSDTRKTYIVGNINLIVILVTTFISAIVHMAIVSTFIYITAPFIFNVNTPTDLLAYSGWLFVIMIISTIIGMYIGVTAKNSSSMTMISQVVFLSTMLLSGIMLPTEILPTILERVGKILPATYALELLTSLSKITLDMVIPLLVIGLIGLIALIFAYRKTLVK